MKIAVIVSRFLMAFGFVVLGLNILHPFLPQPPFPDGSLPAQFMAVMGPTHWMMVVGIFQVVGGLLLLTSGTTPMGLVLLAPVLVNILCFHTLLMNGEGILPGAVFSILEIFLLYAYRNYFRQLLTTKATPAL